MLSIKRLIHRFLDEKVSQLSGSLAYTTLLAIVPILIILFSLGSKNHTVLEILESLKPIIIKNFLPGVGNEQIMAYFVQFASSASEFTYTGLAIILVTGILLCSEIETAFLHIWSTHERPIWQRILTYSIVIILGPIVFGAVVALALYVLTHSVGLVGKLPMFELILNYGLIKGTMFVLFFVLYKFLPNAPVKTKYAIYVSAMVTATFVLTQWGFQVYLANFHTYTVMYGTFYLIPILLVWIYVSWCIVLVGSLVLHELHTTRTTNHEIDK